MTEAYPEQAHGIQTVNSPGECYSNIHLLGVNAYQYNIYAVLKTWFAESMTHLLNIRVYIERSCWINAALHNT